MDSLQLRSDASTLIATAGVDTVASKVVGVSKIMVGAAGVDDGYVSSANPLPISVASIPSHAVTNAGTFAVQAAQSGTWNVTNVSGTISLPTGAATSAKQDTEIASLASIDGKLPSLGQALAAASIPIVLTAAQITTLTPPVAITGFATAANQTTELASLASIDGKITAVNTGAVVISSALPAGTNNIGDVDVLSVVPGTGATNLGKAVDAATGATDTGVLALATRDDALSALTPVDGDNVQLRTDANGALWVIPSGTVTISGTVTANAGSGTLAVSLASVPSHAVTNAGTFVVQVDGTALTRLTDIETNTDSGAVVGNGAAATAQRVTLANDSTGIIATVGAVTAITNALPAGTNAIGKLAANSGVDIGDVDVTSVIPGTGATNLGKAFDAARGATDTGLAMLAVRVDSIGDLVPSATDDYTHLQVNSAGSLWVTMPNYATSTLQSTGNSSLSTLAFATEIEDGASGDGDRGMKLLAVRQDSPATTSDTDGDYELLKMSAGRLWGSSQVYGAVAHDAADSGNPIKVGGIAKTSNQAAVADADRVNAMFDKMGRQTVVGSLRENIVCKQTQITTTGETTIVSAVASTFMDLYGLLITNTSATGIYVTIKDDTAGTTRMVIYVPATETRGFMLPIDSGHPQAVVNKPWTTTCSSGVSNIEVTTWAVKNL